MLPRSSCRGPGQVGARGAEGFAALPARALPASDVMQRVVYAREPLVVHIRIQLVAPGRVEQVRDLAIVGSGCRGHGCVLDPP